MQNQKNRSLTAMICALALKTKKGRSSALMITAVFAVTFVRFLNMLLLFEIIHVRPHYNAFVWDMKSFYMGAVVYCVRKIMCPSGAQPCDDFPLRHGSERQPVILLA